MNLKLSYKLQTLNFNLKISGSKSETNRLLILQALYPNLVLENTSSSDDSEVMLNALQNFQLPTSNFQLILILLFPIHRMFANLKKRK